MVGWAFARFSLLAGVVLDVVVSFRCVQVSLISFHQAVSSIQIPYAFAILSFDGVGCFRSLKTKTTNWQNFEEELFLLR
jgi:hypothetical protein